MAIYAGLDVSDKSTHVCLVDGEGAIASIPGTQYLTVAPQRHILVLGIVDCTP